MSLTQNDHNDWGDAVSKPDPVVINRLLTLGMDPETPVMYYEKPQDYADLHLLDEGFKHPLHTLFSCTRKKGRGEAVALLIAALEKKYEDDPARLANVIAKNINRRTYELSAKEGKPIVAALVKAHIHSLHKEAWFGYCQCEDGIAHVIGDYLARGFDPDARDAEGHNGLFHFAAAHQDRIVTAEAAQDMMLLISGLEEKYQNEPQKLLDALTNGNLVERLRLSLPSTPWQKVKSKLQDDARLALCDRLELTIAAAEEELEKLKVYDALGEGPAKKAEPEPTWRVRAAVKEERELGG